ncbi:CsbD family protein [Cupriavidus sp. RAF12]
MNKDQVQGRVTEAAGKVKEAFGKMTGNKETQLREP